MKRLTDEAIGETCAEMQEVLRKNQVDAKEVLRLSLVVEEALLIYRERFGASQEFLVSYSKTLRGMRISIRILNAISVNPFNSEDGDDHINLMMRNLLSNLYTLPTWSYANGCNCILISVYRPKKSPMVALSIATALGVVLGVLCGFLPEAHRMALSDVLVTPLYDTFIGVLSAVAGPIVFFSIVCAIYGVGDKASLGRIGKKMLLRFLTFMLIFSGAVMTFYVNIFSVEGVGTGVTASSISDIVQLILGIVPSNCVAPFVEGNMVQIIFLATVVGTVMLLLGQKVPAVVAFTEQANFIIVYIVKGVGALVPFYIFVILFNVFIQKEYTVILDAYLFILLVLLGLAVVLVTYALILKFQVKASLRKFIKKILPVMSIAVLTGSTSVSFLSSMEIAKEKLGADKSVVSFGVPIGQVLYMPGMMVLYMAASFVMAESHAVPMTITWLVMTFIVSALLSVVTPPITGGALACYSVLFLQLGIPTEALAAVLVLNAFVSPLVAGVNMFALHAEVVTISHLLGKLDREKLDA